METHLLWITGKSALSAKHLDRSRAYRLHGTTSPTLNPEIVVVDLGVFYPHRLDVSVCSSVLAGATVKTCV